MFENFCHFQLLIIMMPERLFTPFQSTQENASSDSDSDSDSELHHFQSPRQQISGQVLLSQDSMMILQQSNNGNESLQHPHQAIDDQSYESLNSNLSFRRLQLDNDLYQLYLPPRQIYRMEQDEIESLQVSIQVNEDQNLPNQDTPEEQQSTPEEQQQQSNQPYKYKDPDYKPQNPKRNTNRKPDRHKKHFLSQFYTFLFKYFLNNFRIELKWTRLTKQAEYQKLFKIIKRENLEEEMHDAFQSYLFEKKGDEILTTKTRDLQQAFINGKFEEKRGRKPKKHSKRRKINKSAIRSSQRVERTEQLNQINFNQVHAE